MQIFKSFKIQANEITDYAVDILTALSVQLALEKLIGVDPKTAICVGAVCFFVFTAESRILRCLETMNKETNQNQEEAENGN